MRTNFGIEGNVLSRNEGRDNDCSKGENPELRPHKPTLMMVERFECESGEGINVPITVDEPSAKQNPDEVYVRNICDFRWCQYGKKSQERCVELQDGEASILAI